MLGEALRLIRVFHDCKAADLAVAIGVSPSHISEIEKGKKTPSMDVLQRYADYFETTPSVILFFAEGIDDDSRNATHRSVRKHLLRFLKAVENATA